MKKLPVNYTIRPLAPNEWDKIQDIYTQEFGNAMPDNPEQSAFLGVFFDDQLVGFSHVEVVFHLNAVYLNDEHRQKGAVNALLEQIDSSIPPSFPVFILSETKIGNVPKKFGFRDVGSTRVWRRDY